MKKRAIDTDVEKVSKINEALRLLMNLEPIVLMGDPKPADREMLYGLAQAYANEGFRRYLLNLYLTAVRDTALRSEGVIDQAFGKARILTLKELLVQGKKSYDDLQRIEQLSKKKK